MIRSWLTECQLLGINVDSSVEINYNWFYKWLWLHWIDYIKQLSLYLVIVPLLSFQNMLSWTNRLFGFAGVRIYQISMDSRTGQANFPVWAVFEMSHKIWCVIHTYMWGNVRTVLNVRENRDIYWQPEASGIVLPRVITPFGRFSFFCLSHNLCFSPVPVFFFTNVGVIRRPMSR